ncbi:hypothetical protein PHAVU_009G132400 [Phaseolus vulgaris]|uniref:Uncharacterized protein n=1 Tax=Phaseolus vulgaris TaxID=3885 RepID=V7AV17_PHAVU|nr:hypothetical protein PHAVU_009G132400g [Phaseolus vulgaris]ESW09497.1 hypothetical protein PHAVU_009G132400g [Phaseolus vulgaris]
MLDPRTHHPTNSFHLYDDTRHKPHTTWEPTNSLMWPSKSPFQELNVDDSGICSPPMWTTSPPHTRNDHRGLSPTSRTQAIVRGQRELMEMVKNMPESNYELSLKDLVEHHRLENEVEDRRNLTVYKRDKSGGGGGGGGKRVGNKMVQVKKNGNIDRGGFYLKMGLPFSLGSKEKNKSKKKKNESSGNSSSRVTPKPDGSTKGGVDKEWWKKSPSACKGSDSGESSLNSGSSKSSGSSSSSSSNSRSNSRREKGGRLCWGFIRRPKSQTRK